MPDEDYELEEEEEDHQPFDTVRAKWTIDGATTLSEAAALLREKADRFEELEREGWQLRQPIDDDYGFISRG